MIGLLLCARLLWQGPDVCTRPEIQCACSECFSWNVSAGATRYEIERMWIGEGTWQRVGILEQPEEQPRTTWCPAKDVPEIVTGYTYIYRVSACNSAGCAEAPEEMTYTAAPYRSF